MLVEPTSTRSGSFHICPRCARAVPARSGERYCANDGERLLEACPKCGAGIRSPYARFCTACGAGLIQERPDQRARIAPLPEADGLPAQMVTVRQKRRK